MDVLIALTFRACLYSSVPLFPKTGSMSPRFRFLRCPSISHLLSFNQTPLFFLISSSQDASSFPLALHLCLSCFLLFKKHQNKTLKVHPCDVLMPKSVYVLKCVLSWTVSGNRATVVMSEMLIIVGKHWAGNSGQQESISFPRMELLSGFHS